MDKASTEVQTTEATSHQDIIHSDESLDGLRAILFPDRVSLYTGPGADTARELRDKLGLKSRCGAYKRAQLAVRRGEMVEVEVLRTRKRNGGEYVTTGWVVKAEYDEWMNEQDK